MIRSRKKVLIMKKSNSDIVNHVKSVITEKKDKKHSELQNSELEVIKEEKIEEKTEVQNYDIQIDNEIQKWIQSNAEKICKEIVREEVKKIFK